MNMMFDATIHKDISNGLFCGEIKDEKGHTSEVKISKRYSEIKTWAEEKSSGLIDLDIQELIDEYM